MADLSEDLDEDSVNDQSMAERFAKFLDGRAKFDQASKEFYVFHDHVWVKDNGGWIRARVQEFIEQWDFGDSKQYWKKSTNQYLHSNGGQRNIIEMVKPIIGERQIVWHPKPELLGAPNGVVDLRTGELRDGRPKDEVIGRITYDYDSDATSDLWDETIEEAFSNQTDKLGFVHRLLGYLITGYTHEKVYAFMWGGRNSGKTTISEAIKTTLGDYGAVTNKGSFILQRGGRDSKGDDLKRLEYARFVLSTELVEGDTIDSARMKPLASADLDAQRLLWSNFGEVKPQYKIILVSNTLNDISENMDVDWEREITLHLGHTFPDSTVRGELLEMKHQQAIMAWLVKGSVKYLRAANPTGRRVNSLWGPNADPGLPEFAKEWRNQHRQIADVYTRFHDSCLVEKKDGKLAFKDIFGGFRNWLRKGDQPMTISTEAKYQNGLGIWLAGRYGPSTPSESKRWYHGLAWSRKGRQIAPEE